MRYRNSQVPCEDDIKRRLLEQEDNHVEFRKTQGQSSNRPKFKRYSHSQLSQWSTAEQTTDFSSLPFIQAHSQQKFKLNSWQKGQFNKTSISIGLNKNSPSKHRFNSSSELNSKLNPINISFDPECTKDFRSKSQRKASNLLGNSLGKGAQKNQQNKIIGKYMVNGEYPIICNQKRGSKAQKSPSKQMQSQGNTQLLRLLRQKQLLRKKRYSFQIESGLASRSFKLQTKK